MIKYWFLSLFRNATPSSISYASACAVSSTFASNPFFPVSIMTVSTDLTFVANTCASRLSACTLAAAVATPAMRTAMGATQGSSFARPTMPNPLRKRLNPTTPGVRADRARDESGGARGDRRGGGGIHAVPNAVSVLQLGIFPLLLPRLLGGHAIRSDSCNPDAPQPMFAQRIDRRWSA